MKVKKFFHLFLTQNWNLDYFNTQKVNIYTFPAKHGTENSSMYVMELKKYHLYIVNQY